MEPRRKRSLLWTPLNLGGSLALWLDAADPGTLTPGTGVAQWRDKGPRGAHAAQATGANQPTLVAGALNGLPAIRCASQHLAGALVQPDAALSMFAVARMQTGAVTSGRIIGLAAAASADSSAGGVCIARNTTGEQIRSVINGVNRSAINITYDTPFIVAHVINSAGIQAWVNGGSQSNGVAATTIATTLYTIGTSIAAGAPSTAYWSNDIHEVLVLAATAAESTRQLLEGYLAWKWGLQGSLVSTHPYATARPYG